MKSKIINVLETFSGIGAQHKAIKKIGMKGKIFNIKATADWDARANIAYAAIHHDLLKNFKQVLQSKKLDNEQQIDLFLSNYAISLDSKKQSRLNGKDLIFKQYLAASIILTNNQVDITKMNANIIENEKIDLVTYSFPCQGLSVANMGRAKGINNKESTSSLVWEIHRILNDSKRKPKYLLMENVRNLLSNKFKPEYEKWLKVLSKLGYKTFTTTINAAESGSIQKRIRVFALSVQKSIKTPFKNDAEFNEYVTKLTTKKALNLKQRSRKFNQIFNFDLDNPENIDAAIKNTPSRIRMVETSKILNQTKDFYINTVTTKQDRLPCTGIIEFKNNLPNYTNYRLISPREAYKLMGFEDQDFDKLLPLWKQGILTKESLYRQAGNSIVVEAIQNIFEIICDIEKGVENE